MSRSRPSSICHQRSARCRASSSCVATRQADPAAAARADRRPDELGVRRRPDARSARRRAGSRDSSRSARAIATRCCCPIEICAGYRPRSSSIASRSKRSAAGAAPSEPRRQLDVLLDGQLRHEAEALRDVGELAPRSSPPARPCPRSGSIQPPASMSSVDLPDPERPTTSASSPARTETRRRRARRPPRSSSSASCSRSATSPGTRSRTCASASRRPLPGEVEHVVGERDHRRDRASRRRTSAPARRRRASRRARRLRSSGRARRSARRRPPAARPGRARPRTTRARARRPTARPGVRVIRERDAEHLERPQRRSRAQVLRQAQLREEVVGGALRDVRDRLAAEPVPLSPRERREVAARNDHPAGRRSLVTGDEAKQRRLAAARDTHDRRHVTGSDARVRRSERVDETARGRRSASRPPSSTTSGSADTELLPDAGPRRTCEREDRADQPGRSDHTDRRADEQQPRDLGDRCR